MNAEERIQMLKQVPADSNFERKRKIRTAIALSVATALSVLSLIFAFIQKQEADRQRNVAVEQRMEAEKQREQAEQQRIIA